MRGTWCPWAGNKRSRVYTHFGVLTIRILLFRVLNKGPLLEGSWVVISRVISPSPLIWVILMVTLLITPLITTHEPLSRP